MNNVSLTGRITHPLEMRQTTNGKSVIDFSIAVRRDKDNADFINIQSWNQSAEYLLTYGGKGALISVVGKLRQEKYTGKDGVERTKVYVISDRLEVLTPQNMEKPKEVNERYETDYSDVYIEIKDDDLPFY